MVIRPDLGWAGSVKEVLPVGGLARGGGGGQSVLFSGRLVGSSGARSWSPISRQGSLYLVLPCAV